MQPEVQGGLHGVWWGGLHGVWWGGGPGSGSAASGLLGLCACHAREPCRPVARGLGSDGARRVCGASRSLRGMRRLVARATCCSCWDGVGVSAGLDSLGVVRAGGDAGYREVRVEGSRRIRCGLTDDTVERERRVGACGPFCRSRDLLCASRQSACPLGTPFPVPLRELELRKRKA